MQGWPNGFLSRDGRLLLVVSEACLAVAGAVVLWLATIPPWLTLLLIAIWLIHALVLLRLIRESARAAHSLMQAKQAADQAMLTRGAFLSTMSHEIRTPMNAVLGMAGLLRSTRLDTQQAEFAKAIEDSAHALLGIVNDVLDFSKIDVGKMEIAVVEFDLSEVVEASAEALSFKAHEKQVRLLAHVDTQIPPRLLGDPGRIRQILLNLLGNALKFTDHGEVVLRVQALHVNAERCRIRVEVRDSGIGMDADTLRRLFSPFSQADNSVTRQYGGTGLGLSICKRLVELMGGSIGVESTPGAGSCFWFELGIAVVQGASASAPASQAGRVLLLEPHAQSAAMLEQYLHSAGLAWQRCDSASAADALLASAAATATPMHAVLVSSELRDPPAATLVQQLQSAHPALRCILLDHGVDGLNIDGKSTPHLLQLPLRKEHLLRAVLGNQTETEPLPRLVASAGVAQAPAQHELLLVEDNVMNQKVAVYQLNAMGYAVDIANNGAEAIERLASHRYALVLMDCQMPVLDGYQATRRIRSMEGEVARIPVIAMTANAMAGDREACLAAGMDDYLTKPLLRSQLAAILQRYLPPLAAAPEPAPAAGASIAASRLQELFGEDRKLADEMLSMFVEHTAPVLQELEQHCQQQQPALVEIMALGHRLAGSCLNLGIDLLGQRGRQIEMAARQGDVAAVRQLASACRTAFEQLRLDIDARIRESQ